MAAAPRRTDDGKPPPVTEGSRAPSVGSRGTRSRYVQRSFVVTCFVIGAVAFGLATTLPRHAAVLTWFDPVVDVAMIMLFALVAVLGCLDAILRRHARSLPVAAAAAAAAVAWIPHLITFPGVVPGRVPLAGPQTTSLLATLATIGTPAALAVALTLHPGPLARPRRTVGLVIAAAVAATLAVMVTVMAIASHLPATIAAGHFTLFRKILLYVAVVPIAFGLLAFATGRRGDERVGGSVAAALVLLLFETPIQLITSARYLTGWYIANGLRLAPAVALLIGQLNLYARTVAAQLRDEAALRASETRTRAVIAAASEGYVEIDREGRVVSWNERAERQFGWPAADIVGRTLAETIAPPPHRWPPLDAACGDGAPVEATAVRRDGAVVPVEISVWPVDTGDITAYSAFVRDISARKAAEAERAQLAAVVEYSDDAIITTDPEGVVRSWNAGAQRLYGYRAEETVGREATTVLAHRGRESERAEVRRRLEGGESVMQEVSLHRADGLLITVSVTSSPIFDGHGRLLAVSSISRDVTERRRAEEALAASEERFRLIQHYAPIGLALVGLDGRWIQVNPALCTILGRRAGELEKLTFADITHPDDGDAHLALTEQLLAGVVGSFELEKRYIRGDGRTVWAALNVSVFRGRNGEPQCFITQIQDITERRETREQLKLQGKIVDAMAEGVTMVRLSDHAILFTNPQFDAMFGYDRGELIGRPVGVINASGDGGADVTAQIASALTHDRAWSGEVLSRHKNGSAFWRQLHSSTIELAEHGPVAVSIHVDISERKRAADELNAAQERFRLLVDGVVDYALYMVDRDGFVTTWNAGAQRLFGYSSTDVVGQSFHVFFERAQRIAGLPDQVLAAAAANGRAEREGWGRRHDGSRFWANVAVSALLDDDGVVMGYATVWRDMTESRRHEDALRRAAAELARSNADLEEFASVAAHDLKSPLAAISGFAQLLETGAGGTLTERGQLYAGRVVRGTVRMQELIDDLLGYARLGSSQNAEWVDTAAMAADVAGMVLAAAPDCAVTIGPLPTITADPVQLRQLLQNLLTNAAKFRHPDHPLQVDVSARRDDMGWVFAVADNGIGIDPRFQERVFQMFQRLHTIDQYPGTGMGLAICRRVVENHGGRIWAEAAATGGTVFHFALPDQHANGGEG